MSEIERIAGVEPAVDEAAVLGEVEGFVRGWQPADDAPTLQRWRIESLGAADWALAKLAEIEAAGIRYDDEIERWVAARARVMKAAVWFRERLEEWAIRERTPSRKSFQLPHGTVSTRQNPRRVAVDNDAAVLEWARTHRPDVIETTERVKTKELGAVPRQMITGVRVMDDETAEITTVKVPGTIVHTSDELTAAREWLRKTFGSGDLEIQWVAAVLMAPAGDDTPEVWLPVPGMHVTDPVVTASPAGFE